MSYPPYISLNPQISGFHQYPPPRFIPLGHTQQHLPSPTPPMPCSLPGDAAFEYFKRTGCLTPHGRIAERFKHNGAQNLPLGLLQLDQISLLLSKHLDLKGEGPSLKDLLNFIVNELGKRSLNTPLLSLSLAGEGLFPLLASTGYFHHCLVAAGLTHFPLTPEQLADQHDGSCRIAIQLVMHREGEQNLFLLKNAIRYFFKEANCPVQIKEESCGTSSYTLIFHQDSIHEISLHIIDDHKSPPVEAPYCFSIKGLLAHEDTEACYPEKGEHPLNQHFFNTASSLIALKTPPQNPIEEWLAVNRQLTCGKRFVDANARMENLAYTMQHGQKIEALCEAAGKILKSMMRNEAFCLAYQICLTAALPAPDCAQLFALLPTEESAEEANPLQEMIIACLTKESVPFALVHGIVASCGLMQLHSSKLPGGKDLFKLCRDGSSLGLQFRPEIEKCCLIPLFPGQILQQMLACHQTYKQSQMETFSTPLRHLYALLAPKAAFMQALPQEMQFLKHHYTVFKDLNDWANQLVCSGTPLLAHLGINLHFIPFLHGFGIPPEKDILDAFPEALALDLPEAQQKFLILNAETHLACHSNYKNSYLQKISRYAKSRREDNASLNSRLLTFLCRETSVKRLRTAMRLWTRAYDKKEGLSGYAAAARDKLLNHLIGAKDLTSATEFLGFLVKKECISGEKALEAFCMIANALIRKEECPEKREHVAALASLAQPLILKLKRENPSFDPVWTSVSFGWLVEQLLSQGNPLLAADILLLASDHGLTASKAIDLPDLYLNVCTTVAASDPMSAAVIWQLARKKQQWGSDRPAQEFVCQLAEKLLEAPLPEAAVFAQQCVTYLDRAKLLPEVAERTHTVTRELARSLIRKNQFENAAELIENTTHLTGSEHIKFYLKIFKREAKNLRTEEALFALQKAASLADAPIKKRKIAAKALLALQQLLSHENANRNACLALVYAVLADSKAKAILSADKSTLAETLLQSIELGIAGRHLLEIQDLSALLLEVLSLVLPNTQSHRNGKYLERTAQACLAVLKGTTEAKSALDPALAMQFKRCHQQLFLGLMQADMPLLTISLAEAMQKAISVKGWHKDAKYALLCAAAKLLKDNSLSSEQISDAENALSLARQISKNSSVAIVDRETAVLTKLASLYCNAGNREQTIFHLKWMGRLNPEHLPEETYHELIRLALVCLKEYAEPHLALRVLQALKKCAIKASGEHINLMEELLAYFASNGEMETTLQILIDNRNGMAITASVEWVLPFVNKAVSAIILTPTSKGLAGALNLLDSYPEAEPALLEGVLGVIAQGADSVNKQKAFALWKKAEATHLFEDQPERRLSCWCHACALSPQLSALEILLILEKLDEMMACVQTLAPQKAATLHAQVFEAVAPLICEAKEFKLSVTACAALLQARTELPSASSPEARHSKIDIPLLKAALRLNDLSLQTAVAALLLELARSSGSQRQAQELFPHFRQAIKQTLHAKAHSQPKAQEMLCAAAEFLLPGIMESSACYALAKDLSHLTHESRGTCALKVIQRGISLQIVPKTHKNVWIKHNAQSIAEFKKTMAAVLPLLKDPEDCEAFLQVLAQPGGTLLLSRQDNVALTIQMTGHCLSLAQNNPEYSQEYASRAFALFLKYFSLVETNHSALKPLFQSALELMLATLKRQQDIAAYDKQYNALIGLLLPNEKKLRASGPNPASAYYPYFSAVVHAHLSALTDGSLPSRECALAVYEKTVAEVSSCWLWFDYYNVKEGCNVMERFCSLVAPVEKIAHLERAGEILRFGCEKRYAQKAPHTIRNLLLMVNQLMVSFAQEPMGDPSQAVTISSNCSRNLIAAIEADLLSATTFHECFLSIMYLFPPSAYGDNQEHLKNIIAVQQAANKKAYFKNRIDLYYQALLLATFSLPSEAALTEKSRSAVIYAVLENLNRQPISSAMIRAFEILKFNRDSLLPEHFAQSRSLFLTALSNLDTEPYFKAELCGMYLSVFGPDSAILTMLQKLAQ